MVHNQVGQPFAAAFMDRDNMNVFLAEFIGTAILILLGNGVVANVKLQKTYGHGEGLIVIATGWALAVFAAVACVGDISGAHINPAVTIGLVIARKFAWSTAMIYIVCQMAGGLFGAILVWVFYMDHYKATDDADAMLGTFCNAPAIRNLPLNLVGEIIATFVLVYAVLMMTGPKFETASGETLVGLGSIGAVNVALIVFVIGLCLGGTTGYAINPARDFSPRVAHAILPIAGKRDSDWSYSMIPVIGPILGGVLAAVVFLAGQLTV
jgi:glycerol uptake facilitator protein